MKVRKKYRNGKRVYGSTLVGRPRFPQLPKGWRIRTSDGGVPYASKTHKNHEVTIEMLTPTKFFIAAYANVHMENPRQIMHKMSYSSLVAALEAAEKRYSRLEKDLKNIEA